MSYEDSKIYKYQEEIIRLQAETIKSNDGLIEKMREIIEKNELVEKTLIGYIRNGNRLVGDFLEENPFADADGVRLFFEKSSELLETVDSVKNSKKGCDHE